MKVSVVIPTFKRIELLQLCLRRLTPEVQQMNPVLYEVVVTDDCKEESAKNALSDEFPWVRWVKGPARGPAANRNHGVRQATSEWILLTDDDCLPDQNWVQAYKIAFEQHDAWFFEGKTIADRSQFRYDEEAPLNLNGGLGWSCNIAFHKKVFDRAGGFDEAFPYPAMEDVDFHQRVIPYYSCVFVQQAVIVHPWRRIDPFKRMQMQYASRVYYYRKHKSTFGGTYRWKMFKSFLITVFQGAYQLIRFGGRGFKGYLAQCMLRFKLIFVN